MKGPWRWRVLGGLALLVLVAIWSGRSKLGDTSSSLSRASAGWLGARLYLQASGFEVQILDRPLSELDDVDEASRPDLLILTFPLQRALSSVDETWLFSFLRAGGNLLLAYSGAPAQAQEKSLLGAFAVELEEARRDPSLVPWRWWSYRQEEWRLQPEVTAVSGAGSLLLRVPHLLANPTRDSRVLYRASTEDVESAPAVVFELHTQGGQVMVMPASLLSNARLLEPGHADLLSTLAAQYGQQIAFDEYHHGLVAGGEVADPLPGITWDLLIVHLGLFYLLGWLALGRRMGPAWREPRPRSGSAATFLRQLGTLHGQLGHHGAAARLLVERLVKLDPGFELPADLGLESQRVSNAANLLSFARRVARYQRSPAVPRARSSGSSRAR